MKNEEVNAMVDTLLNGSANLDQMEKRIHGLVALLMGIMRIEHVEFEDERVLAGANGCWTVICPAQKEFVVQYFLSPKNIPAFRYDGSVSRRMQINHIQRVNDDLGVFLNGIVENFPVVRNSVRFAALLVAGGIK